jgi:hypothetical protein
VYQGSSRGGSSRGQNVSVPCSAAAAAAAAAAAVCQLLSAAKAGGNDGKGAYEMSLLIRGEHAELFSGPKFDCCSNVTLAKAISTHLYCFFVLSVLRVFITTGSDEIVAAIAE